MVWAWDLVIDGTTCFLLWLKLILKFVSVSLDFSLSPFIMAKAMKKAVEEAPPMKKGMRRAMKAMKTMKTMKKKTKTETNLGEDEQYEDNDEQNGFWAPEKFDASNDANRE